MKDLTSEIKAYALKNAIEFEKAVPEKILPKLFQHGLEKKDVKKIMPKIQEIVKEVNTVTLEERKNFFKDFEKYIKVREEKEHELPELPNVKEKMVFRLAPFPSGALHIGNAKTYLLNALYAQKYKGKILLVMDDTIGSEEKQLAPESYQLIEDAFKWLNIKYEKPIIYKSDRLEIYYKYAIELIKLGKAYVDPSPPKKMREMRKKGIEHENRKLPPEVQIEKWKEMFSLKECAAVLRIKTDMKHPNPAFRDRVLFKISERGHPRVGKKYRVWPSLEMSWTIDDVLLGVTHIIRGTELQMETEMEKFIWDIFKWQHPETIHVGLVTLEGVGAKISKSKSQKEVKSGVFTGWDDPRTWSIQSLRRRGILPEAILEFVSSIGLNKQYISVPIDSLYAINRKLLDAKANRYSFISSPINLKIENKPDIKKIEVPIHPDKKETKTLKVKEIFISEKDFKKYKGKEVRLLHLYNLLLDKKQQKATFTSLENKDIQKLNWVSDFVNAEILMPDGKKIKGIAESTIRKLKNSEVIQFERFSFVRFDKKVEENYEFWFAHK